MLLLKSGEIFDLRLQHNVTLQEGYTTPDGERIRPIVYKAEFSYIRHERRVYEDAKGYRTAEYKLKRKLAAEHGIKIVEV